VAAKTVLTTASGELMLDGSVNLRDLETQMRWSLPRDGGAETLAGFLLARLASEVRHKPGLTRFFPATLSGGLDPEVSRVEWQGSGDLANTATANCFLVVPHDRESLNAGEVVTVLLN